MKIEYKITKYFKDNNLFTDKESKNINISIDLVELADIIISVAKDERENSHIHIDKNTLINNESDYNEIIIEKY